MHCIGLYSYNETLCITTLYYHIAGSIGGVKHGEFSYLDYLEEKSLVNGLIMANGY